MPLSTQGRSRPDAQGLRGRPRARVDARAQVSPKRLFSGLRQGRLHAKLGADMRFSGYFCGLLAAALLLPSCTRPFWRRDAEPRVAEFLLEGTEIPPSTASAATPPAADGGAPTQPSGGPALPGRDDSASPSAAAPSAGIPSSAAPSPGVTASSAPTPAQAPAVTHEPGAAMPVPTPAQQAAARALLNRQASQAPSPAPSPAAVSVVPDDMPYLPQGQLRTISPVPPEEAASSAEQNVPPPNAVERRGLRSPSLPKVLPMDINGRVSGRSGS